MKNLVDQTILFCEVQRQNRHDKERGDYEVYVFTFRYDDEGENPEQNPVARASTSHTAVFGEIEAREKDGTVPFVATIRKTEGKGGKSGYYFLEALDQEELPAEFPF